MIDTFYSLVLNRSQMVATSIFIFLFGWWTTLHVILASSEALQLWAAFYQIIAWFGAIIGFATAMHWGGAKSALGKAALAFSCGLLLQSFGQSAYSIYIYYLGINVPYPSIGDIGFFGSIPCYLYGALMLAKASGVTVSLKAFHNQLLAITVPLGMLLLSSVIFLRGYTFDWSQPVLIFLDIGYPLGQACYVSIAMLAFLLSRKMLGGMMRVPILFFIYALFTQYISDFLFIYQSHAGTYVAGGIVDFIYLISYFLMTLSLIQLGLVFHRIQKS